MRRTIILAALGAALMGQAVVGVGMVHADSDCKTLLANNLYRCTFVADVGGTFDACFQFTSPGTSTADVDLDVDSDLPLACDCQAKGSLKKPLLGTSSDFQCVLSPSEAFSLAFTGQVKNKGGKLKQVQGINGDGVSFLGECAIDPTCSAETMIAGGGGFRSR